MTTPPSPHRNRAWVGRVALLAVLAVAAWLRLDGVGFGLPALNDPDEPLFIMTAFDMLRNHTPNPGWFGHPGTITLYCLSLLFAAIGFAGTLTGRFDGADGFAAAVFADPAIVVLPGRLLIVACGLACVLLTYWIGRRLWGGRAGLFAAAILAVNALHIEYSQVIRTDMQASVFMLLCVLRSLAVLERGARRDYVIAGVLVGLACATKWPAAAIALGPICAGLARARTHPGEVRKLALFAAVAVASLIAVSPFLLLDQTAVLRDLTGEVRAVHPGATGGGLIANLAAYARGPLLGSFGAAGLTLIACGIVGAGWRDRRWTLAVMPGFLLFAAVLAAQHLIWDRWLVPLLPFLALAAAWTLARLIEWVASHWGRPAAWVGFVALGLLLLPMLGEVRTMKAERRNDTRQVASAWIRANVPAGSSIVLEHGALDLLDGPWALRFPLGSAGCIDPRKALSARVSASQVERRRVGQPVVDLGHVDHALIDTCRADYAVLSHYARYRAEPDTFPEPLRRYRELIRGGTLVALIEPAPGKRGGPVIHIFRLDARNRGRGAP